MARVPYQDEATKPDQAALIDRIKTERGGRLLNLYKALLNSPPVAEGWLNLFTAIRQKGTLPDRDRELAIMRVAVINGALYEFNAHVPFALKSGMTQPQIDDLAWWRDSDRFSERERAVLAYTDTMTKNVQIPDDVFAAVRKFFDDRELVELTATVGGYNLVSRFLEAMQIDHDK
ncbi:MAG: carboxymuconolactone decarboxylase family protein [Burkholderiales bacterium]